ncbi:MAG: FMN-binding negative transcriptional regulator [Chloroflexota bacterium]|nr:FMN-binding negative transcriptional regulator [Chloroflexota bacterium]MDE3193262.1 FMN-binding negative transcriptional regulator [Chloroflexota bacterium]
MYVPQHFREDRLDVLHALMEENSFATCVSASAGGIVATHIPVLLDRSAGPLGTLRGHIARANKHWERWTGSSEMLVMFQGPHAYVSPSWYASSGRVPTWNYLAVHAYGTPRATEDPEVLRRLVDETTHRYEDGFETPWRMSSVDDKTIEGLLQAIVGFEMPIARLEGKRKLGQNRSRADREAMVRGLRAHGSDDAAVIADLVAEDLR